MAGCSVNGGVVVRTGERVESISVQEYARLLELQFSSEDMTLAFEEWSCNCGPAALAAVLKITLEEARDLIPEFVARRYTSPTMMGRAIDSAGLLFQELGKSRKVEPWMCPEVFPERGLVRVQWTGPWTAPDANPKWAYRKTHWFSVFSKVTDHVVVFDVNCGPVPWSQWVTTIPKLITDEIERSDGGWYLTHLWEVGQ